MTAPLRKSCSIGLWVEGKHYGCELPLESIRKFRWWEGIDVNLPYPVRDSLVAMYRENFHHRFSSWRGEIDPFLTGYCLYT